MSMNNLLEVYADDVYLNNNLVFSSNGIQYTISPSNLANISGLTQNIQSYMNSTSLSISSINTSLSTVIQSITIGKVSTSDAGSSAQATITTDSTNPHNLILNLTLPRGVQGPPGDSGGGGGGGGSWFDGLFNTGASIFSVGDIVNALLTSSAFAALESQIATVEGEILALQTEMLAMDTSLTDLQQKTMFQSSTLVAIDGNPATSFTSEVRVSNGLSTNIKLNPYGTSSISSLSIDRLHGNLSFGDNTFNDATISTSSSTLATSDNVGTMNIDSSVLNLATHTTSTVNIGSATNFSQVNINSSNTNITGILSINGIVFQPQTGYYISNGFFNQF